MRVDIPDLLNKLRWKNQKVSFTPSTGIQTSVTLLTRYETNYACSMFTTTVGVILFWILPHLISYKGVN